MSESTVMAITAIMQPDGIIYLVITGDLPSPLNRSASWRRRHVPDYGDVYIAELRDLTGKASLMGLPKPIRLDKLGSGLREIEYVDLSFNGTRLTSIEVDGEGVVYQQETSELLRMEMVNIPFAKKLKENGVTTLRQIADMTKDELKALDDKLGARGRITDPEFQAQARALLVV